LILNQHIGQLVVWNLLLVVALFAVLEVPSRFYRRRLIRDDEAREKFYARSRRPYRVWQVSYILGLVFVDPWGGFATLALYLAYILGVTRGYSDGLTDARQHPAEMAKQIEEQLKRDWPKVVSMEAARAARDN
jgi:hypothetical protein